MESRFRVAALRRAQSAAGYRVDAVAAQHIGNKRITAQKLRKGSVQHVQASREAAESRHNQPLSIASEAGAANGLAPLNNTSTGMKVPRYLTFRAVFRFVTKDELSKRQL